MRLTKKTPNANPNQAAHRARKAKLRQAAIKQREANKPKREKRELVFELFLTIREHFPDLFDWMRQIDDSRQKASTYELGCRNRLNI